MRYSNSVNGGAQVLLRNNWGLYSLILFSRIWANCSLGPARITGSSRSKTANRSCFAIRFATKWGKDYIVADELSEKFAIKAAFSLSA